MCGEGGLARALLTAAGVSRAAGGEARAGEESGEGVRGGCERPCGWWWVRRRWWCCAGGGGGAGGAWVRRGRLRGRGGAAGAAALVVSCRRPRSSGGGGPRAADGGLPHFLFRGKFRNESCHESPDNRARSHPQAWLTDCLLRRQPAQLTLFQ